MKQIIAAVIAGLLFGLGLVVSSMIDPAKVLGFFDVAGNWDPSLAFVMGGAVSVTALAFPRVIKRSKPVLDTSFHLPTARDIRPELIIGSSIFGIGWGLVGLCPGPAIASLGFGYWQSWVFFAAMVTGSALFLYTRKT